jgi:hypothetical protein
VEVGSNTPVVIIELTEQDEEGSSTPEAKQEWKLRGSPSTWCGGARFAHAQSHLLSVAAS